MKFNPRVLLDLLNPFFDNRYLFLIAYLCLLNQIIINEQQSTICPVQRYNRGNSKFDVQETVVPHLG